MSKKAPVETAPVETATRKKRELSQGEMAIVTKAQEDIANAKARIKEAKSLGKAVALIALLSEFGCQEVTKAIEARIEALGLPVK